MAAAYGAEIKQSEDGFRENRVYGGPNNGGLDNQITELLELWWQGPPLYECPSPKMSVSFRKAGAYLCFELSTGG